ncbi:MAG: hypothetical protein ABI789_11295 [Usitatibacter sp.]
MSRSIRILLAWALAALLPLQGYAAAAMISCGPMHAHQAAMASHHADHAGHHHGDDESAGEPASGSGGDVPALPDRFKFKCSACAACCTGAAAPSPALPAVTATKSQPVTALFFDWSDRSIVHPGLERPPRAALA